MLAESTNSGPAVEDKIFEPRNSYSEVMGFGGASSIANASLDDLALPSTMHPMGSPFSAYTPPSSSQGPNHPQYPTSQSTRYPDDNHCFVGGFTPGNDETSVTGNNLAVQGKKRGRRPRPFSVDGFPSTSGPQTEDKHIPFTAKSLFSPRALSISDLKLDDTVDASIEDTGVTVEKIASFVKKPDPTTKQWTCLYPLCGKQFGRKENVKSHVQTHLGDRQFKCNRCNKRFVRGHDLKRHAKIHTGLKPYPCECGNSFARHDALTRHKQRGMCSGSTVKGEMRKPVRRGRPPKNPRKEDDVPSMAQSATKPKTGEKKRQHGHSKSTCSFSSAASLMSNQANHLQASVALNNYSPSPMDINVSCLYTPPESPERGPPMPASYACSESTGSTAATEPEIPPVFTNGANLLPLSSPVGSTAVEAPDNGVGPSNMTSGAISNPYFPVHPRLKPTFRSAQPMMDVSTSHMPTAPSTSSTAGGFPVSSNDTAQMPPHSYPSHPSHIPVTSLAYTGGESAYVDPTMLFADTNTFANMYPGASKF